MKKLLWVSPYSMHDTSSGAAIEWYTILKKLANYKREKIEVMALGGLIFDHPNGKAMFTNLDEQLKEGINYYNIEDSGVHFCYVKTKSTREDDMISGEQRIFFQKFLEILAQFKPDVIMGYGGDLMSGCIWAEAQRRGIPTVYCVCNGNHKGYAFPGFDLVLCDSNATAAFYGNNFGMNCIPKGIFIEPKVIAKKRDPKYVTLINPSPAKGISYFAKIAHIFKEKHPDVKFLVVDSRGTFRDFVGSLKEVKRGKESFPYKDVLFDNVDVAQNTPNVALIYEQTKILLAPSLWYESWGRVASEAVMNGIPVLASKSGGLIEAVNGGGINLDTAVACQKDYMVLPSDKDIKPWVEALEKLLKEDWSEKCKESAKFFDIDVRTENLVEILEPLFAKKASQHPQYLRSGYTWR